MKALAQPFEVLYTVNKDVVQDTFGRSLNVGDPIVLDGGRLGRIIRYDHSHFHVAALVPDRDGTMVINQNYAPVSPTTLINVRALYDQQRFDDEEVLYAPCYDLTPSEQQKCSKKYLIALVVDVRPNQRFQFRSHFDPLKIDMSAAEVIVASIPGSTEMMMEEFVLQLNKRHGKTVASWFTMALQSSSYTSGPLRPTTWTVYNGLDWQQQVTRRQVSPPPLNQLMLTKKFMTDNKLMDVVNTIMPVFDFNDMMTKSEYILDLQ